MKLPLMGHIAVWSALVPGTLGMWRFRTLARPMKLFAVFCLAAVLNVLLEFALSRMNIKNYFLSDLYFFISVPFLGLIYFLSVTDPFARSALRILSVLFVLIWLVQKVFFADPTELSSTLAMITAIFLVIMSILTFNGLLKSSASSLSSEPIFWVLTGTIVYYSGSFAVMGLGNLLLKNSVSLFVAAWYINWILTVAAMLLYARGFLCKSQV